MYDLHAFAAHLLGFSEEEVEPGWELVGLMYRHIQLQHRAMGLALDRLQEHNPVTGFTYAAEHQGMTGLLTLLTSVYAAVSTTDLRITALAKHQLDQLTPDPDQYTPDQWACEQELEAQRAGLPAL